MKYYYRRSKKPFIVDLVLLNVLSVLNGEMSSFYMKRRTRRKMPFIIVVLCRVIIWHEMEHPLCVKMTRQFLPYFYRCTLTINEIFSDWTLKRQGHDYGQNLCIRF